MFEVFVCRACPLIFRVGGYAYSDLTGSEEQVVCYGCGTMHRLVEQANACRVFALPGPVRDTDLDAAYPADTAWQLVGTASGVGGWRRVRCAACRQVGQVRSRERLPRQAEYP